MRPQTIQALGATRTTVAVALRASIQEVASILAFPSSDSTSDFLRSSGGIDIRFRHGGIWS